MVVPIVTRWYEDICDLSEEDEGVNQTILSPILLDSMQVEEVGHGAQKKISHSSICLSAISEIIIVLIVIRSILQLTHSEPGSHPSWLVYEVIRSVVWGSWVVADGQVAAIQLRQQLSSIRMPMIISRLLQQQDPLRKS